MLLRDYGWREYPRTTYETIAASLKYQNIVLQMLLTEQRFGKTELNWAFHDP